MFGPVAGFILFVGLSFKRRVLCFRVLSRGSDLVLLVPHLSSCVYRIVFVYHFLFPSVLFFYHQLDTNIGTLPYLALPASFSSPMGAGGVEEQRVRTAVVT